jgi:uncharacterized protein YaeQ
MSLPEVRFQFRTTLSDPARDVSAEQTLNLSLHPSETMERLYLRLIAWALFWTPGLRSGPGLSTPDEPALYDEDLTGRRTAWIAVNPPAVERMQFAVRHNKGAAIAAVFGSESGYERFLESDRGTKGLDEVEFVKVEERFLAALAANDERRYDATITIVENWIYVDLTGARSSHPGAWNAPGSPTRSVSGTFERSTGPFPARPSRLNA